LIFETNHIDRQEYENYSIAAAIELQKKKTNKTNEKPSQHELYRFFGG